MQIGKIIVFSLLWIATCAVCATQQDVVPGGLKEAALRDAACTKPGDAPSADQPALSAAVIRAGGKDVGTIVEVQGACHCQSSNCDTLVYLRQSDGYRLTLHEKYASLHPMKIVKRGMPSLTGKFEVSAQKAETTVYDWDGKDYRPSLCATVTRRGKLPPAIARHSCKAPAQ